MVQEIVKAQNGRRVNIDRLIGMLKEDHPLYIKDIQKDQLTIMLRKILEFHKIEEAITFVPPKIDQSQNLNRSGLEELKRAKLEMDKIFEAKKIKKADDEFTYAVAVFIVDVEGFWKACCQE
jgi:hypothetical protein